MASKNKSYASLFSGLSSTSGRKKTVSQNSFVSAEFVRFRSRNIFSHSKFFSANLLLWLFRETAIPALEQLSRIQCCEVPRRGLCEKICKKIEARREKWETFFGAILNFLKQNKIFSRLGLGNGRSRIIAVAGIFSYLRLSFCGAKFFDLKTFANSPSSPGFDSQHSQKFIFMLLRFIDDAG